MKVTALLTGRGNNTLKDKNVLDILGRPVLYYPAVAAKNAKTISAWYVSSDDEKILNAAGSVGFLPIVRPLELALPTSQHIDCILHALERMKQNDDVPDILVVILANNVTVKSKWIDDCVTKLIENPEASSVIPVYEDNDHHPLRAKTLSAEGTLLMYEKNVEGKISTNRQDLPLCLFPAHNFWVLRVSQINAPNGQPPWSFMGEHILPYQIHESIDIHEEIDLYLAKQWIIKNWEEE
ncbi:CMP-N-acetylneuraminic acid synthetase [Subdoligranulum sp. AM23-21AC]|uniref:acylneuraminate cytidylyltransferase family protein n=1 Tax=Ruthenibacterium lactatiformans TaxID=1550024 RepID=UPI000240EC4A|nr:hypothetical protein [Ruthenibacterium lactatiformans]EHL65842.1 hypothetical protein HMPREF1032_01059 [Subdoligranulum sp. 4_3_54A2FAA]RGD19754.1 CMP-N-acetylneuraminic acid synthetase [Subdoligranulum sp. AM23-21AC]RJW29002.1 CMP-N-acetylneuraminic acid synthetase [Subdoligranulum sp. TF05-17AC]